MKKQLILYCHCQFTRLGLEYIIDGHPELAAHIEIVPYTEPEDGFGLVQGLPAMGILVLDQNISRMILQLSQRGATLWNGGNVILITPQGFTGGIGYLESMMNVRAVLDMTVSIRTLQSLLLSILKNPIVSEPFRYSNLEVPLSVREKTVINGLLSGKSASWLAEELGISYKTVSSHKRAALIKLGVRSLQKLVMSVC